MREIKAETIVSTVRDLCIEACCVLPNDLCDSFCAGKAQEESEIGKSIFDVMIENAEYAKTATIPACQDTGMAVVFVELGQDIHVVGNFEDAIHEGVRRGYVEGCLRLSVVGDPLRRVNTNDNTPAIIHTRVVPGDRLTITVAPKGFGSENMSAMRMFKPANTADDVCDFVVECVSKAGSNPCPPVVVGVGLGGTIERAALCAKHALTRDIGSVNPDPLYAELERKTLEKINALGIGPQGLGGTVTALAVHFEPFATHIAGLPCVVNMGCHITRHASAVL
ncbi:MAG: fumarate hydratase [Oscillospiraceae bacterium]|nr:fumarate hydratase [Oscillospiraceae bacterium]